MIEDANGTYLSVSVGDCSYAIDRACEGAIEVAYRSFQLEGKDAILELRLLDGDDLVIAASRVTEYALSTPAGRARHREFVAANERADREARKARGWSADDA